MASISTQNALADRMTIGGGILRRYLCHFDASKAFLMSPDPNKHYNMGFALAPLRHKCCCTAI